MRPSWHLDVKWLSALATIFLLFAASISFMLHRLTEHDTATGTFTAIAVSLVEENFDTEEFERVKAAAAASPDAAYTVPGVNVNVTGEELADLTPTQALELVIGRAADTLYYEGPDAAQPLFQSESGEQPADENGDDRSLNAGPFSILSRDTHDYFQPLAYAFALVAAAMAIPLILSSRRFGRLGSPGMALLAATAPLALLWEASRRAAGTAAGEPDEMTGRLAAALTPAIDDLSRAFLVLAAVGGIAVALAVGGHIVTWTATRSHAGREEPETGVPTDAIADPAALDSAGVEEPSPRADDLPSIRPGGVPQA